MSLNRIIAVSIDSSIELAALAAVESLNKGGWHTQLFITGRHHSTAFEHAIRHDPSIHAVFDCSLGDLVSARLGTDSDLANDRLTSAAMLGLPQVIIPGSVDHVVVHPDVESVDNRKTFKIDDVSLVIRTSVEDNDAMGKELAFMASASKGPVIIVFPRGGLSKWDAEGQPLHDAEANQVLLDSLHLWNSPNVEIVESHRHINDPQFIQIAVDQLLKLLVVRE